MDPVPVPGVAALGSEHPVAHAAGVLVVQLQNVVLEGGVAGEGLLANPALYTCRAWF